MRLFRPSETEYNHAYDGTVFVRLDRGVIRGDGADRLDLLHRLSTNATSELSAGDETTTILTTDRGRILEVVRVVAFADHILMVLAGNDSEMVRQWLDRYTIMDDFRTTDVSDAWSLLGVYGERARTTVSLVVGKDLPDAGHYARTTVENCEVITMRDTRLGGAGGFMLLVASGGVEEIVRRLSDASAIELSNDTYEALRVEAGQPVYGRELSDRYNPLEAGIVHLVSFTKGCYIGQEVIARLDSYDKVQKHLVGLVVEGEAGDEVPELEVRDAATDSSIGSVTSVAYSPAIGKQIALAYVRTQHAVPGADVVLVPVQRESTSTSAIEVDRLRATITKLPFDR